MFFHCYLSTFPTPVHSFMIFHPDHYNVFLTYSFPPLFIRFVFETLVLICLFLLKKLDTLAYGVSLKCLSMIFNGLIISVPIFLSNNASLFLNYLGSLAINRPWASSFQFSKCFSLSNMVELYIELWISDLYMSIDYCYEYLVLHTTLVDMILHLHTHSNIIF